jgi:hypothetical protein
LYEGERYDEALISCENISKSTQSPEVKKLRNKIANATRLKPLLSSLACQFEEASQKCIVILKGNVFSDNIKVFITVVSFSNARYSAS